MNLPRRMALLLVVSLLLQPIFPLMALSSVQRIRPAEAASLAAESMSTAENLFPSVGPEVSSVASVATLSDNPYLPVIYKTQVVALASVAANQHRAEMMWEQNLSLRAAGIFSNPLAIQITELIPQIRLDPADYYKVFFTTTKTLDYRGGRVLISSTPDGGGPILVDDQIAITVTHPDGSKNTFIKDFGLALGCPPYPAAVLVDVTQYFAVGTNNVEVELKDTCGFEVGSTALWLVPSVPQEQGFSPNECPFCGNVERVGYIGGPINTSSRNYNYEVTDLSIPTAGQPLQFVRSYNSRALYTTEPAYAQPLGLGWTHNHDIRLLFSSSDLIGFQLKYPTGTIGLKAPHGSLLTFYPDSAGNYMAAPGIQASMTRSVSSPYMYTVTTANQTTYVFTTTIIGGNPVGRLLSQRDPTGQVLGYTYYITGPLKMVSDPSGQRYLQFFYKTNDYGVHFLQQIRDPLGRHVDFNIPTGMYDCSISLCRLRGITDTRGLTWTYQYSDTTYNPFSLTGIIDPDARTLERTEYSSALIDKGKVVKQWNGANELVAQFTVVSSAPNIITMTDALSRTTVHNYSSGVWAGGTNAATRPVTRTYDANFRLGYVADPNGHGPQLTWSPDGDNLKQVVDAGGYTTAMQYDGLNNPTLITDTRNFTTAYVYSGTFLTRKIDAYGNTWIYTPTSDGRNLLAAEEAPGGRVTEYQYDPFGQRTVVTDALKNVTRLEYDAVGRLITTTDAIGRITVNAYDPADHVIAVTNNFTTTSAQQNLSNTWNLITRYGYDGFGRQIAVTDTLHHITRNYYDSAGRLIKAVANFTDTPGVSLATYNLTTTFGYDAVGNQIAVTDTLLHVTRTEYDNLNRPVTVTQNYKNGEFVLTIPDEDIQRIAHYDPAGNVIEQIDPPNANGESRVTRNWYDSLNRVISSTTNYSAQPNADPNTYNLTTRYEYDPAGNQVAITDTLQHVTRNFYDAIGRLVRTVAADGTSTSSIYAPQVQITEDANRHVKLTLLDALGRPAASDATVVKWSDAFEDGVLTGWTSAGSVGEANGVVRITGNGSNWNTNLTRPGNTLGDSEGVVWSFKYDPGTPLSTMFLNAGTWGTSTYRRWGLKVNSGTIYRDQYVGTVNTGVALMPLRTGVWYRAVLKVSGSGDFITWVWERDNPGVSAGRRETRDSSWACGSGSCWYFMSQVKGGALELDNYDEVTFLTTRTAYDAIGNRVAVTDALTHTTVYTYNAVGQLIAEGNPVAGNLVRYQYDALGRTIIVTDALTHPTRTFYDDAGRVVSTTNALTGTTVITYNALGQRVAVMNENGKSSYTAYDGLGRTIIVTDAIGNVMQYKFDACGNRTQVIDGLIHPMTSTYDIANRLIKTQDAVGNTTRYGYDGLGNRVVMTDANGVATGYGYDALSRLSTVTESMTSTTGLDPNKYNLITRYGYDALGNRTVMTNARGYTTTYTYDALSRLLTMTEPLTHITYYQYDAVGNRIKVIDANNQTTIYTYDVINRNTRIDYGTSLVSFEYDPVGNRQVMTDSLGVTRYVYDELNRLKQVTDPFTGTVQYRYDAVGNRTQLIYPDGKVVTYTFDAANRLTGTLSWDGQLTTYGFDKAGRLVTTTLPNGVIEFNSYDDANRTTRLRHSRNGTTLADYQFAVDKVGNRTSVTETLSSPLFVDGFESGDFSRWSAAVTDEGNLFVSDRAAMVGNWGMEATLKAANVSEMYTQDDTPNAERRYRARFYFNPQLTTFGKDRHTVLEGSANGVVVFQVQVNVQDYPFPAMTSISATARTDAGAYVSTSAADAVGTHQIELDWQAATGAGANNGALSLWVDGVLVQTLSGLDNDTLRVDQVRWGVTDKPQSGATTGTEYFDAFDSQRVITTAIQYMYDPLYRLTNANYSGAYTYTLAYAYDKVGNRTAQTRTITSTQVITYQYDIANRMTKAGGITYSWDNNGNLINDGSATYLYDRANRLISTTLSGITSLYGYNGDGARLKQTVAGTVTTYTQDLVAPLPVVLQAKTGSATMQYLYAIGTRPLGQYTSAWEYLLPDALGSVRQIVDANGNVTLAKSYEPYGTVLTSNGTASSIFSYAGEQLDTTGLVNLRARYMNPRLGIFLARDPWSGDQLRPGSMNGYSYTEGHPINRVDPSGRVSEDEKRYMKYLNENYIQDAVSRLHDQALTNLSEGAFAAMIAAKFLVEDATPFADQQPAGQNSYSRDILMGSVPGWVAIAIQKREGRDYSWGPANIPMPLADRYLAWWEENYAQCPRFENFQTEYYRVRSDLEFALLQGIFDPTSLIFLNIYAPYEQVAQELLTDKGAVEGTALAILESSDRARKYWRSIGQPSHELSAYTIALGVLNPYPGDEARIYTLSQWQSKGFAWDWIDTAVPWVAGFLDLDLGNFLKYTDEEKATLDLLP